MEQSCQGHTVMIKIHRIWLHRFVSSTIFPYFYIITPFFLNLNKFLTIKIQCFPTLGFNSCQYIYVIFFPQPFCRISLWQETKQVKTAVSLSPATGLFSIMASLRNLCITCFFPFGFSWFLKLPTTDYVRSIPLILPLKTIPGMSNLSNPSWTFF